MRHPRCKRQKRWFILDVGMKRSAVVILSAILVSAAFSAPAPQDWIRTGTGLGVEKIRLAVPDFKPAASDAESKKLATTFSVTLWNDLQAAGIFDVVSQSFYPVSAPGTPQEVNLSEWSAPPLLLGSPFGSLPAASYESNRDRSVTRATRRKNHTLARWLAAASAGLLTELRNGAGTLQDRGVDAERI